MTYLLTAHLLGGLPVGVDAPLVAAITEPFKIELTESPGYQDISTIENWWQYGRSLGRDYLFVRSEIKELIDQKAIDAAIDTLSDPPGSNSHGDNYYINPQGTATGAWAGYEGWHAWYDVVASDWVIEPLCHPGYRLCTQEEKDIAAELKIGAQADHFADFGVPAIVDYGLIYHETSIECRDHRMHRAVVEIYNRVPLQSQAALQDVLNNPIGDLPSLYVNWGLKGSIEDFNVDFNPTPTPAIMDYIMARAPFNGQEPYLSLGYPNGMKNQGWTPIDSATLDEFCDELADILLRGIW